MVKHSRKPDRSVTSLALSLSLGYLALMSTLMWMFEHAIILSSLDAVVENPHRVNTWFVIALTAMAIFMLSSWALRRMSTSTRQASDFAPSERLGLGLADAPDSKPTSWRHAIILLATVGIILAGTGAYIISEQDKVLDNARDRQFFLIGKQKAENVSHWVNERRRDLSVLLENEQFKSDLRRWIQSSSPDTPLRESIRSDLNALLRANNFDGLSVVNRAGAISISIPDDLQARTMCRQVALEGRKADSKAVSLSAAFNDVDGRPKLDVIGTFKDMHGQPDKHVATLCMRVDLDQRLLPMVSRWPDGSRSGEVLLGRTDGDDLVLINGWTDSDSVWTSRRLAGARAHWEALQKATDNKQLFAQTDSAGTPKLQAAYAVSDTPWIVMIQMDAEEANLLQARKQRYATIVIGFVLLFVVTAFSIAWARTHYGRETVHAQRDAALEQLQEMAFHDDLTGLPRRRLLIDRLEVAIMDAERRKEQIGVMFIDVNKFKTINDTYGHAAGDAVLQAVAHRLKLCVRKNDTAGRLSGDEFLLLLTGNPDDATLQEIRKKITQSLQHPIKWAGKSLVVTVSIGLAIYPTDGTLSETLIEAADRSMYKDKKHGDQGHG